MAIRTPKSGKAAAKSAKAGKAIAQKRHGEIYNEVDAAKIKLRAGDVQGAMVNLMAADQAAGMTVQGYRGKVAGKNGSKKQRQDDVKCANELIVVRGKIDEVIQTIQPVGPSKPPRVATHSTPSVPTPKVRTSMPISPRQPMSRLNIGNKEGYSRAGGLIQAPPGAGMYMRVPFQPTAANPVANAPFSFCAAGAADNFTMTTPQLPWLTYRLRGLVVDRQSDFLGGFDSITIEDLREQGGPNLVIGEGRIGVESFRMGDRHLVGLRYNPIVQAPNFLEVRVRSAGPGQVATAAGNTVLYVSAIIETIEDTTYGTVNALTQRLNLGHFGGGQGNGYVFPTGAPVSGTIQRVPMRAQAATAVTAINASTFRLNNAANQIILQSEQISWAELQIVGVEFGTPNKTNPLDVIVLEDLQVGGGASLFAQAGQIPGINFLGDEAGRGGGMHSMCGLRHYPLLSATNTATMTLSGLVPTTGVAGLNGTVDIPYVNILVDRLVDDVFGVQPAGARSPYASAAGLLP